MTDTLRVRTWRAAALVVLLAWFAAVQVLNGAGHLSVDSLIQLNEGRSGVMTSFNPVFITVLFGKLAAFGGTRLLVVGASLMLLVALFALLSGVGRPRFAGVGLLACALAGPIMLIYPAIVWKDVWFAHFALLGFAVIALRRELSWALVEAGSLVLFAAATLSRPNGVIVAVCGAATLAWARWSDETSRARASRRTASLLAGVGARFIALLVLVFALSWVARLSVQQIAAGELSTGIRILFHYDITGMIARDPAPDLSLLAGSGVDVDRVIMLSRSSYSAERIDLIEGDQLVLMWSVPDSIIARQWLALVTANPAAYLGHRADVFSWLLGLHDQMRCAPVWVGYADSALVAKAGVSAAPSPHVSRLYLYSLRFVNTPYFSPAAWALASAMTLAFAMVRRRFDPVMIGLQVTALAYLGAYFFVSLSCDFRYAYFSVLAATVGLVWLVTGATRRTDEPATPMQGRGDFRPATDR